MSPTDTELSYLPARFYSFYRMDQIFHILSMVNSDCIYQVNVLGISNPAACSDGELDNFNNYYGNQFAVSLYNATYGEPVQEV